MTSARSVITSAVALGFAGAITVPLPALAHASSCAKPGSHAAQSSAQLLRINRLELGAVATPATRSSPGGSADSGGQGGWAGSTSPAAAPAVPSGGAASPASASHGKGFGRTHESAPAVSGVALGDARSVLIANGSVKSAAASRALDGRVAGGAARGKLAGGASRNDLVAQQAPPGNRKASTRLLGAKRFGPLRAGSGNLSAQARWNDGLACGSTTGEASTSSAELNQVTLTGGGNQSLVRVPDRFTASSTTGVRQRGGKAESVSTTTLAAGRLILADGEVRIRVLRAATLRVSMSSGGRGEVDYQPPVVEVTQRDGKPTLLNTPGDYKEITLGEEAVPLESLPAGLTAADPLPLPSIPGLPALGDVESTPAGGAAGGDSGARLRISLGAARQATKGRAIAARATAVKISLVRGNDDRDKSGYSRAVVADLGLGRLEGAAVAPKPLADAPGGGAVSDGSDGSDVPGGSGSEAAGVGAAGLPITGPGAIPLLLAGSTLVIGGVCVFLLSSRRRREV
ncbi:hypothetical protein FB565_004829 [Actinoplanes lutulentus]|uniref:Gram-positive cocci surface proteins LPxTG domain-containing protein n=1 Tax=Actinoplanes lutulentus TaxID=1287878 RepID=A0A327Z7F2_9ACTN|nr:hypothetical protein [Actinoplanes lutulentus]MBB2945096.1 hypothetical protein [Actinoplanes lutulentus]RAK31892.1 hypothetical protein B0I29_114141 [Actinoplanes lutulentus]